LLLYPISPVSHPLPLPSPPPHHHAREDSFEKKKSQNLRSMDRTNADNGAPDCSVQWQQGGYGAGPVVMGDAQHQRGISNEGTTHSNSRRWG
jgi:hypothetical protein